MLEDTLTKGERNLVAAGEHQSVLSQRRTFQALMRDEAVAGVEEIVGRRVRAFLSDFSPEDGIAAELFLFQPFAEPGEILLIEAQVASADLEAERGVRNLERLTNP